MRRTKLRSLRLGLRLVAAVMTLGTIAAAGGCAVDRVPEPTGAVQTDAEGATPTATAEPLLPPAEQTVVTADDNYVNTAAYVRPVTGAIDDLGRSVVADIDTSIAAGTVASSAQNAAPAATVRQLPEYLASGAHL